ncbi:lactococcin 972 family bacteriocin [Microbacterium sp.]|uniref:lactococcin 972 family bacteriocin n=1 Tax=Microbacterium sp. TaxID=51671 RepID=UPI00092C399C|nr:lactococcin 972 family bacteriocin [Microbacterium sp.]OJU67359.1 MAG: hypothetical protein BGO04_07615 [Microbacterium sp. 70-38]MBN9182302.1 lactococcin 972 family bacteriocin [Microbacterium sp.]MBN9186498.1 lactococcin 972 family bacteriocin [Microbacterium sp.]MBN9186907.1 lactococcin 972 family bacteriocin [Microbacterium sp.]MBN9192332.1 lactococcin 972 family bacteriocin [Microbacterium sp.]
MYEKKKHRRVAWVIGGLALGALVLAPAAAASASTTPSSAVDSRMVPTTTKKVGGGLWQYGRDGFPFGNSWSNYHHPTKYHSATACDGAIFVTCKQVVKAKNVWAKASVPASPAFNTAYWNTY